uniref:Mediator of RNA polymerase II transcription subunit 8 n=1 Tax=Strongyloides venezuelensis TaxID=75913 RepID=A0A0K0F5X6_STRVS
MSDILYGGYQHEPEKVKTAIKNLEHKVLEIRMNIESTLEILNRQQSVPFEELMGLFTSLANTMTQMQTLLKRSALTASQDDSGAFLRSHLLVPQAISLDYNETLHRKTEGRIPYWNHDVVPEFLSTKISAELEAIDKGIESEKNLKSQELVTRQINQMNKHIDILLGALNEAGKIAAENHTSKPTYDNNETEMMVRAMMNGEGLHCRSQLSNSSATQQKK